MVVCMLKLSSYSWIGPDLLQASPILHNMFEPSKHSIKMTFAMPLKLSLDVTARILTWVLYVQDPCSWQPFPAAPVCVLGWGLPWALVVAAGRMQCYMKGWPVPVPYALKAIWTSRNTKFSHDDLRDVIYYLLTKLVKQIYDTFTYSADAFSRKVPVFPKFFMA